MNINCKNKAYQWLYLVISGLIFNSSLTYADDTEIYLNAHQSHGNPNILFVLDDSGSMGWGLSPNDRSPRRGQPTRMQTLKKVMNDLLDDLSDVNAGIMTFNQRNAKARDQTLLSEVIPLDVPNTKQDIMINLPITKKEQAATEDTGGSVRLGGPLALNANSIYAGLHFEGVNIDKNTIIKNVELFLYNDLYTREPFKVSFQQADNPPNFSKSTANKGLSSVGRTWGAKVNCRSETNMYELISVCTSQASILTSEVQKLVKRTNWKNGNNIVMLLERVQGNLSFRGDEAVGAGGGNAFLRITAEPYSASGNTGTKTGREILKSIVNALHASGGTPTGETFYQAARYMSEVKHGSEYPPSPIIHECQKNHIILLSDGEPNADEWTRDRNEQRRKELVGTTSCSNFKWKGQYYYNYYIDKVAKSVSCMAEFLATTDQSQSLPGNQFIKTDAIGFAVTETGDTRLFLDAIVEKGGGGKIDPVTGKPDGRAYVASNASELKDAFANIIGNTVNIESASSRNISVAVNSANRSEHLDQVYYPMYSPSATKAWDGNVKRYRLKRIGNTVKVVDVNDRVALLPSESQFSPNAKSYWSAGVDGNDLRQGGAAGMLSASKDRKRVFSKVNHTTSDAGVNLLGNDDYKFTNSRISGNGSEFSKTFSDPSIDQARREALRKYALGLKDGVTETKILGDSLNSSPQVVTYKCKDALVGGSCVKADASGNLQDNSDGLVIFGTNEGFVHFVDMATGAERAAFMPAMLVQNLDELKGNGPGKIYGVDNPVVIWKDDKNGDGYIYKQGENSPTADESVYVYVTLGRGGNGLYALDATKLLQGELYLKWQIIGGKGGTKGFEHLGQTWSQPVKAKIKFNGDIKDVLVFGGGYDESEDDFNDDSGAQSGYNPKTEVGNALYIVDAKTGEKIWSAGSHSAHDLVLPQMTYGIPARVRLLSLGGDTDVITNKLATQIFVGDMGGQIWRLHINHDATSAAHLVVTGSNKGLFANLGANNPQDARRFYNEADAALQTINGKQVLTVNIGSGYRAHPLNTTIEDRVYSLRTEKVAPDAKDPLAVTEDVIEEASLYDATANLVQKGTSAEQQDAELAFNQVHGGYYIKLNEPGEKMLSTSLTADGKLYFNTFIPSPAKKTSADPCATTTEVGFKNRAYSINLLNATPLRTLPLTDPSYGDPNLRYEDLDNKGIAGSPQIVCLDKTSSDCIVIPDVSISDDNADLRILNPVPQGTMYWIDRED